MKSTTWNNRALVCWLRDFYRPDPQSETVSRYQPAHKLIVCQLGRFFGFISWAGCSSAQRTGHQKQPFHLHLSFSFFISSGSVSWLFFPDRSKGDRSMGPVGAAVRRRAWEIMAALTIPSLYFLCLFSQAARCIMGFGFLFIPQTGPLCSGPFVQRKTRTKDA